MGCCHYDHDNSLHCFLAASQTNDWVNIRRVHNDRDEASKGHVIVILRVTDATDYDGGTLFVPVFYHSLLRKYSTFICLLFTGRK